MKKMKFIKMLGMILSWHLIICFMYACEKDNIQSGNGHIKKISCNGELLSEFVYNENGELVEYHSINLYERLTYDDNGRLIKIESDIDQTPGKKGLITALNSEIDTYSIFEYDQDNLLEAEYIYYLLDGKFEFMKTRRPVYENGRVVIDNYYDHEGKHSAYNEYSYDQNSNLIYKKFHSDYFIFETTFKFDAFKNPFTVYSGLGQPGQKSNSNNITVMNHKGFYYYEDRPFSEMTTQTTYEYNKDGYPVKAVHDNDIPEIYSY